MNAPVRCCPACRAVTVAPHQTSWTGDQVRAWYRCRCGHAWDTSWDVGALGAAAEEGVA